MHSWYFQDHLFGNCAWANQQFAYPNNLVLLVSNFVLPDAPVLSHKSRFLKDLASQEMVCIWLLPGVA